MFCLPAKPFTADRKIINDILFRTEADARLRIARLHVESRAISVSTLIPAKN